MLTLAFDPVIIWLGPVPLGWHGIFASLGILLGAWLVSRRLRAGPWAAGIPDRVVAWAVVGAFVGARIFHVMDHADQYAARPLDVLAIWRGGIAVYGGFAGALTGAVLAARRAGLPIWPFLDAAAGGLLLGQAVGRIGCLLNGDAWGAPTGGWGVVYLHPGAYVPHALLGVPTHPYPLYEAALDLLLLAALLAAGRRTARPGTSFLLSVAGYACVRFALSFTRQEAAVLWGLQQAQVIALLTGTAAIVVLMVRAARRPLHIRAKLVVFPDPPGPTPG